MEDETLPSQKVRRFALAVVVALGAASCAAPPTPTLVPPTSTALAGPINININNGTTVPITVAVNGTAIATEPAGGVAQIATGALPARPWTIDALSPPRLNVVRVTSRWPTICPLPRYKPRVS